MSDIQTIWNSTINRGDYQVVNGALASGSDVETAVLISLFTDAAAQPGDVIPDAPPTGIADRRGWWGDVDSPVRIGSRLWLLDRAKGPLNVVNQAKSYAAEALQWLLDDGVVAKFDIDGQWVNPNQLNLTVISYRTDGSVISLSSLSLW